MRTKSVLPSQQRQKFRQFVNKNAETVRKNKQSTDQKNLVGALNRAAPVENPEPRKLPLFMEPLYKARDFDPL